MRDLQPDTLRRLVPMKKGDWYNAKQVEDTVTSMTETAGLFGYAFAEINPEFRRNKDDLTMGLTFKVEDAPPRLCRTYRHQRKHSDARQGDPPRIPPADRKSTRLNSSH